MSLLFNLLYIATNQKVLLFFYLLRAIHLSRPLMEPTYLCMPLIQEC